MCLLYTCQLVEVQRTSKPWHVVNITVSLFGSRNEDEGPTALPSSFCLCSSVKPDPQARQLMLKAEATPLKSAALDSCTPLIPPFSPPRSLVLCHCLANCVLSLTIFNVQMHLFLSTLPLCQGVSVGIADPKLDMAMLWDGRLQGIQPTWLRTRGPSKAAVPGVCVWGKAALISSSFFYLHALYPSHSLQPSQARLNSFALWRGCRSWGFPLIWQFLFWSLKRLDLKTGAVPLIFHRIIVCQSRFLTELGAMEEE